MASEDVIWIGLAVAAGAAGYALLKSSHRELPPPGQGDPAAAPATPGRIPLDLMSRPGVAPPSPQPPAVPAWPPAAPPLWPAAPGVPGVPGVPGTAPAPGLPVVPGVPAHPAVAPHFYPPDPAQAAHDVINDAASSVADVIPGLGDGGPLGPAIASVAHAHAERQRREEAAARGGASWAQEAKGLVDQRAAERVTYAQPPSMADWSRVFSPLVERYGVPLAFVLRWVQHESGGNPCSIGVPDARGPDGMPRELGIAQWYNPSDLNRLGLSSYGVRAMCEPGDQHPRVYKGRQTRGFSERMIRRMTPEEMVEQAKATLGKIVESVAAARVDMAKAAVEPAGAWGPSSPGFWALVKLQHGLPGISRGLPKVRAALGRPPKDWKEFRAAVTTGVATLDPGTEKYRSEYPRIFDNAEDSGRVVGSGDFTTA